MFPCCRFSKSVVVAAILAASFLHCGGDKNPAGDGNQESTPAAPTNLTVFNTGDGLVIEFEPGANSPVPSYFVVHCSSGVAGGYIVSDTLNPVGAAYMLQHQIVMSPCADTAWYRVSSVNSAGESGLSEGVLGIRWSDTQDSTPSDTTPHGFSATVQALPGDYRIDFSFDGNPAVVYRIYRSASDTAHFALVDSTSGVSYTDTGLAGGMVYYYRFTETYLGLTSLPSLPVTFHTAPEIPTNLRATGIGEYSFLLAWDSAAGASQYQVYLLSSGGSFEVLGSRVDSTRYFISINAGGHQTFVVSVQAISDFSSVSARSDSLVVVTRYAPPSLYASTALMHEIRLSWLALADESGVVLGATYSLMRSADSLGPFSVIAAGLDTLVYRDTSLGSAARYYYRIQGFDSQGDSSLVSGLVAGSVVRTMPPDSAWKDPSYAAGVRIVWSAAEGAASYQLHRKSSYDILDNWHLTGTTADTFYEDQTPIDYLGYRYSVKSVGDSGEVTSAYVIPYVVAYYGSADYIDVNLSADTTTPGQVTLAWSATTNGSELFYNINRRVNSSNSYAFLDTTVAGNTSWVDTNVTSGDTIYYNVDAMFEIGGIYYGPGATQYGPIDNNAVMVVVP